MLDQSRRLCVDIKPTLGQMQYPNYCTPSQIIVHRCWYSAATSFCKMANNYCKRGKNSDQKCSYQTIYVKPMLNQSRRRYVDIKPTLGQRQYPNYCTPSQIIVHRCWYSAATSISKMANNYCKRGKNSFKVPRSLLCPILHILHLQNAEKLSQMWNTFCNSSLTHKFQNNIFYIT